jgi:hypothetical protein
MKLIGVVMCILLLAFVVYFIALITLSPTVFLIGGSLRLEELSKMERKAGFQCQIVPMTHTDHNIKHRLRLLLHTGQKTSSTSSKKDENGVVVLTVPGMAEPLSTLHDRLWCKSKWGERIRPWFEAGITANALLEHSGMRSDRWSLNLDTRSADVETAWKWLSCRYRGVIVVGSSYGALVATRWVERYGRAADPQLRGLISLNGPNSFQEAVACTATQFLRLPDVVAHPIARQMARNETDDGTKFQLRATLDRLARKHQLPIALTYHSRDSTTKHQKWRKWMQNKPPTITLVELGTSSSLTKELSGREAHFSAFQNFHEWKSQLVDMVANDRSTKHSTTQENLQKSK